MDFKTLAAVSYTVASELAALRNEPWMSLEGHNSGQRRIVSPHVPGAELYLTAQDRRFKVSGGFPATSTDLERRTIGIADDASAEHLAREINRRLLPGYLAELARVTEYNAKMERRHAARGEVLAALARALGGSYRHPEYSLREDSARLLLSQMPGAVGGDVIVRGEPDTVDMTLRNVPEDVARRMLAVLAAGS